MSTYRLPFIATALLACAFAHAQAAPPDLADRRFVEQAAIGGMAEVDAGRMAQQRAASQQVRQFAERMVQDHTKANDELKALATSKGITLPAEPSAGERREMHRMNKLSGREFDRAYMKRMVADHRRTLGLFDQQANAGRDPELKAYAGNALPMLREHLQMAQAAEQSVTSGARSSTPAAAGSAPGP